MLPSPLLAASTVPFAGRLADRFGFRVVIVPGVLAMVAGETWLATETTATALYPRFVPGLALVGLAIGFAFSALSAAGAAALPPAQFGSGSSVVATARQLGAVLGVAALVAVLGEPRPDQALTAFHQAYAVIAVTAAACALVCTGLSGRPRMRPLSESLAAGAEGGGRRG